MSSLPQITIDTNIYVNAASGAIVDVDWQKAKCYVRRNYRYRLSYATYEELLLKLGQGSGGHFEQNRRPLGFLDMGQRLRPSAVLGLPFPFAVKKSLDIDLDPSPSRKPEIGREVINVLRALERVTNKAELKSGVRIRGHRITFDLDDVCRRVRSYRDVNVERLNKVRDEPSNATAKDKHAELILIDAGVEKPTQSQVAKFSRDIDAMLTMSTCFQMMMKDQNFDAAKHASHLDDAWQLLYLSEPSMHILTMDEKEFVTRIQGSPQQSRILLWKDFIAAAS